MAIPKHQDYPPGLERVAKQLGMTTTEFINAIIAGELIVRRPSPEEASEELVSDEDETVESVMQDFQEGWSAAMKGETISVSDLKKFLDSED